MTFTPVVSSNVKAVGYASGTLIVQLHSTSPLPSAYRYSDVPPAVHAALMASASKGNYLHRHVSRNPAYRPTRLTPADLSALQAAQ